ncbi:MAG: TIM barrel protein [Actinomycetia bacterium]|nr:TIM barrel protein [Actinomycetes bacterium]
MKRIAGAPITWGVDGSPGWGHLMDADRVMSEMRDSGLSATELGPDGFLPTDPDELVDYVDSFELSLVGGFVPAVLYRRPGFDDQLRYVERASSQLAKGGSKVVVLGPDSHFAGYDTEIEMDEDEWKVFITHLGRVVDTAGEHGLKAAVHPHWGMAISRQHQVERMLETCEAGLCLDTGHLHLGGCDPVDIAKLAGDRVDHVHLKDVDEKLAERVRSGELPFRQATIDGMFVPVGAGDVDIAGVITHLERTGYRGWYVLEQDCALKEDPAPGEGPQADAIASVEYLQDLADQI